MAVKACWNRARQQYDWVPPEARAKPFLNFALPRHSFDAYSLAVLMMRLHGGKQWARQMLKLARGAKHWNEKLQERGLDPQLLECLLGAPEQRHHPSDIATGIVASSTPLLDLQLEARHWAQVARPHRTAAPLVVACNRSP